jgi:hypothetical protein
MFLISIYKEVSTRSVEKMARMVMAQVISSYKEVTTRSLEKKNMEELREHPGA